MAKYLMAVMENAVEGQEAGFTDWYDRVHMTEVLQHVAGFARACRYTKVAPLGPNAGRTYLALYEVETDDPQKLMTDLNEALRTRMRMTDTLDFASIVGGLFELSAEVAVKT